MRTALRTVAALAVLAGLGGCGRDAAEREYFAALAGEERGMTRAEQVEHMTRAIDLKPARSWYYETRAIYWVDLKEFERARADLDRDVELSRRPYSHYLRGLVTCELGDYRSALEDFDLAIAGQPENLQFYRGRSLARAATGDAVRAMKDAVHLTEAAPQVAEGWYARGVADSRLGRDAQAIGHYDHALRLKPELVYPRWARAVSRDRLHQPDLAEADRRSADSLREVNSGCAVCLDPFRY